MKLADYLEELAGTISTGDFTGVHLPLLGMIRRPYRNGMRNDPGVPDGYSDKKIIKLKRKKRKGKK